MHWSLLILKHDIVSKNKELVSAATAQIYQEISHLWFISLEVGLAKHGLWEVGTFVLLLGLILMEGLVVIFLNIE